MATRGRAQMRRLSAAEFAAALPLVRMGQPQIDAARASLVDGRSFQSIADEHGWASRNTAYACVQKVWAAHEQRLALQEAESDARRELPPGWQEVTLVAPKSMIREWRAQIAQAVNVAAPASRGGPKPGRAAPKAAPAKKRAKAKATAA